MAYTAQKAAEQIGISQTTLSNWTEEGLIPSQQRPNDGRNVTLYDEELVGKLVLLKALMSSTRAVRNVLEVVSNHRTAGSRSLIHMLTEEA